VPKPSCLESRPFVNNKCILAHEFTRPHKFALRLQNHNCPGTQKGQEDIHLSYLYFFWWGYAPWALPYGLGPMGSALWALPCGLCPMGSAPFIYNKVFLLVSWSIPLTYTYWSVIKFGKNNLPHYLWYVNNLCIIFKHFRENFQPVRNHHQSILVGFRLLFLCQC